MYLLISAAFFAVYVGNVLLGSLGGTSPFGNVGELLLLVCAVLSFVVAILQAERQRDQSNSSNP